MAFAMNFNYRNGNIHCMETPGQRIRRLRRSRPEPISQVQLAALVGVDQSTISDIENEKGLSAENMMLICDALETSPQYVMRGIRDDVIEQIKQLIAPKSRATDTQKPLQSANPMHQIGADRQDEDASKKGNTKVLLVSSLPEPVTPKGANLGTFGGRSPATTRVKNASNKADRVRKQGND